MSTRPSILLGHGHGFTSVLGLGFMISTTLFKARPTFALDRISLPSVFPYTCSHGSVACGLLPSASNRCDDCRIRDAKRWEMRAYRRSDIARGKMRVMLFGHARVGVTELFGDNAHGHAPHGERGTMRVPKDMK